MTCELHIHVEGVHLRYSGSIDDAATLLGLFSPVAKTQKPRALDAAEHPADEDACKKTMLTTNEAAKILGVGRMTVTRWVDSGQLASEKTEGGHRRITMEAIHAFRAPIRRRKPSPTALPPIPEARYQDEEIAAYVAAKGTGRSAKTIFNWRSALHLFKTRCRDLSGGPERHDAIVGQFKASMANKGASASTVSHYCIIARRFLAWRDSR